MLCADGLWRGCIAGVGGAGGNVVFYSTGMSGDLRSLPHRLEAPDGETSRRLKVMGRAGRDLVRAEQG